MTIDELRAEPSTLAVVELGDGRVLAVHAELFGYCLSSSSPEDLELGVRSDVWGYGVGSDLGYATAGEALEAALYDLGAAGDLAEPSRWTRHQPTQRRRPQGDAAREYVRP